MTGSTAERYLRLGLQIGRHVDGIVDAYFGPAAPAAAVDAEPPVDPRELVSAAEALLDELDDGWLRDQVAGLRTYAGVLAGESRSYSDEVEACYGVRPAYTDESVFTAAHERLEELLAGDGPLAERYELWERSSLVPNDKIERTLEAVVDEARTRTRRLAELPDGEEVVLEIVRDKPWWAFCSYLGDLRSRVELNVDLPMSAIDLLQLAIHETSRPPRRTLQQGARARARPRAARGDARARADAAVPRRGGDRRGRGRPAARRRCGGGTRGGDRRGGHRLRPRARSRGRARPRAVPVGGGQRCIAPARGRRERGRGARVSRALGPHEPDVGGPHDPLLHVTDVAELRDHLPGRTRALPLVCAGAPDGSGFRRILTEQVRVRDLLEAQGQGLRYGSG